MEGVPQHLHTFSRARRLRFFHTGDFNPPEEKARTDYETYSVVLRMLLEKLEFSKRYPILKLKGGKVYRATGTELEEAGVEVEQALFKDSPLGILRQADGAFLDLEPFLVAPESYLKETEGIETLVYDAFSLAFSADPNFSLSRLYHNLFYFNGHERLILY